MKTNHLWFGDSWAIGAELYKEKSLRDTPMAAKPKQTQNLTFGMNHPNFTFTRYVSDSAKAKYWNFAMAGGSISCALNQLYQFIVQNENELKNRNIVYLCTTAQSRDFAVTIKGDYIHYHQQIDRHYEQEKTFFKDKLKPVEPLSEHESTKTINEMYHLAKQYNMEFRIINVWSIFYTQPEMDLVPDSCWVLPKDQNLFKATTGADLLDFLGMPVLNGKAENEYFPLNFDVNTAHSVYKDYIYPCAFHPNLRCHEEMAKKLLEILDVS